MMPSLSELRRDFLWTDAVAPVYRLEPGAPAPALGGACVAIGAFDGFHIGHRALVDACIADARARGVRAIVVTFDPDPDRVVGPGPAPKLLTPAERILALASSGADGVFVIPFTRELAALDHAGFFESVLFPSIDVRSIHVGSDFRLGRGGASTVEVMRAWCAPRGIDVRGHELVHEGGSTVCASAIRTMVAAGDVRSAARALGRRFTVRGRVASGRGKGTGMGFPTANISVPAGLQAPADGVYAALALVDGTVWPAAVNAGLPPMFADRPGASRLEANLLGFSGDLYGAEVALAFDRFLRPSTTFESTDALIAAVMGNIEEIRGEFGEDGVSIA